MKTLDERFRWVASPAQRKELRAEELQAGVHYVIREPKEGDAYSTLLPLLRLKHFGIVGLLHRVMFLLCKFLMLAQCLISI